MNININPDIYIPAQIILTVIAITTLLVSASKNLTVFNYDVRSLSKHYDDLLALLKSINATITFIILTET